jgi:hypothetical protein
VKYLSLAEVLFIASEVTGISAHMLAWSSVVIFLDLSGVNLQVGDDDAVSTILNLAADSLSEQDFSSWLQGNSTSKGA